MKGRVGTVASATKRAQGKWLGRYRGPDGRERTKSFPTRGEALAWATEQERRKRRGDWTDPALSKVTLGEWAEVWRGTLTVKPKTAQSYDSLLRSCVLPRWENVRLDQITTADIRSWLATLAGPSGRPLSPSRVRQAYHVVKSVLDLAVEDGRLTRNPAKPTAGKVKNMLPRITKSHEHKYLTHAQLIALAEKCGGYEPMVYVMGYCGLRWGEVSALRVRDLDLLARRIHVRRSVSDIAGTLVFGTPKSHATRAVSFPASLTQALGRQIEGKGPDDPLFPASRGGYLYLSNFRRDTFDPAVKALGFEGVTPHVLRHTAASLAVASGASVKAVQKMLGHASASMTLDVYAGLFDDELDGVAERLDLAAQEARADFLRTADGSKPVRLARQSGPAAV